MNNGDLPAAPLASEELSDRWCDGVRVEIGLTKREYFAAQAMSALALSGDSAGDIAVESVRIADALLVELES